MVKVSRTCEVCGETFSFPQSRLRQGPVRFCSVACRSKAWSGDGNPNWKGGPETRICLQCGQSFEVTPSPSMIARDGGKFCSKKCHYNFRRKPKDEDKLRREDMHGPKHPRWVGSKLCKHCGKELLDRKSRRCGYCSDECQVAFNARSRSHRGNKSSTWKGGPYEDLYCKYCGKQILTKKRVKRVFCSRKCMGKWQSENKSGENSWSYKGGPKTSDYPAEFNPQLRRKVRKRDGYSCQICHFKLKTGGLDVHHIDEDKENSSMDNLITLCRSCHRRVHGGTLSLPSSVTNTQ